MKIVKHSLISSALLLSLLFVYNCEGSASEKNETQELSSLLLLGDSSASNADVAASNKALTTCGGFEYDGYCYYGGTWKQSCTSVCSNRGGSVAAGLTHLSSPVRCTVVLKGIDFYQGSQYANYSDIDDGGCGMRRYKSWDRTGFQYVYRHDYSESLAINNFKRACACAQ